MSLITMLNDTKEWIESNPKKLFVIDGLGAVLSAFLLGIVLVHFQRIFGIPSTTLYFLASLPIFFALYDTYAYHKSIEKTSKFLSNIALMNLLYCCLSFGFAYYHRKTITSWGWGYIIIEILILIILAKIELRISKKLVQ